MNSHLYAWTLNSSTGKGFNKTEINIYIANTSCTGAGMTIAQFKGLVKSAVKYYWNSVPTSSLFLNVKGVRSDIDISSDTHSTALEKVPNNSILAGCNTTATDFSNSSILGSAQSTCSGSTCKSVLILNAHSESKLPTYSDSELEAVIAHEIGHAFGLGHSEYQESLMYYSVSGKYQEWLGQDDVDGVTYLYPHESELDIFGASILGNCGAIAAAPYTNPTSKTPWGLSIFLGLFLAYLIRLLILFRRN